MTRSVIQKQQFNGSIVITDPCYILKDEKNYDNMPSWCDFFSLKSEEKSNGKILNHMPHPSDYPDYRKLSAKEIIETEKNNPLLYATYLMMIKNNRAIMISETYEREKHEYYTAKANWEKVNKTDWEKSDYGIDLSFLGFSAYMTSQTYYGDWSCSVFNTDTQKKIGEFCADAGMVGVFLLDEVLKYNPEALNKIHNSSFTIINNFIGHVEFIIEDDNSETSLSIKGYGNVNFKTLQTGF